MTTADTIAKLAEIAELEIGRHEEPRGSNKGPQIEKYLRATTLAGGGWPWCAAFVCWCVAQWARGTQAMPLPLRPTTASAFGFIGWAKEHARVLPGMGASLDVQRGDIVVYAWSHIGIVVTPPQIGAQQFFSVEGNTDTAGSREGWEVARRPRKRSDVRAFIRLPVTLPPA